MTPPTLKFIRKFPIKWSIATVIGVVYLSVFLFTNANLLAKDGTRTFVSANQDFPLSFEYPSSWNIQEKGSSATTPFAVVISDDNLNTFHARPNQAYPDKFVNLVFYKTSQTPEEYAGAELRGSRVSNLIVQALTGRADISHKYLFDRVISRGDKHQSRHIAAFKRVGDYLLIVETYIRRPQDESDIENVFNKVIDTLQTY